MPNDIPGTFQPQVGELIMGLGQRSRDLIIGTYRSYQARTGTVAVLTAGGVRRFLDASTIAPSSFES